MRQVRVQGCLPTIAVLVLVVALGLLAVSAGLAVVAVTAGVLLLLALVRSVRRLLGLGRPGSPRGEVGIPGVQAVPPGWMEREGGPVVDAAPRDPPRPGEGAEPATPQRDGERGLPPRG